MPFPTWIRDLLGIRKDFVETKKSILEVAKLQDEQCQRELLVRATREDIERYDPNTRFLLKKVTEELITQERPIARPSEPDDYSPSELIITDFDDLDPDNPSTIEDIMEYASCDEERAREFLRKLSQTIAEFETPDN